MALAQPAKFPTKQSGKVRAWGAVYKAVAYSPKLKRLHKAIMNYLTMHMDTRKLGTDSRWSAVAAMARVTDYSVRQIQRGLKDLNDRGYILIEHRFIHGRKAPSRFTITNKIFDEYEQALAAKQARKALGNGCDMMSGSQYDITAQQSNTDQKLVSRSEEFSTPERAENVVCISEAKTKDRKPSTREKARGMMANMPHYGPKVYVPYEGVSVTADRLYDKFGIEGFYALERRMIERGTHGNVKWNARWFEREMELALNPEPELVTEMPLAKDWWK